MDRRHETDRLYLTLRLCYGLVPIVAGVDKATNLLTDWSRYVPEALVGILPVSPSTFMLIVGAIEVGAGLAVLTRLPRLGAYVVAAWLVLIAVNLVIAGYLDVAVRDLVMAVGAYTLGQLAALRGQGLLPGSARTPAPDMAAVTGSE